MGSSVLPGRKKIAVKRMQLHGFRFVLLCGKNGMCQQQPAIGPPPANRGAAALKQVVLQLLELETGQYLI
jgi:hypothetical protein